MQGRVHFPRASVRHPDVKVPTVDVKIFSTVALEGLLILLILFI
jgi:hypothetical protein